MSFLAFLTLVNIYLSYCFNHWWYGKPVPTPNTFPKVLNYESYTDRYADYFEGKNVNFSRLLDPTSPSNIDWWNKKYSDSKLSTKSLDTSNLDDLFKNVSIGYAQYYDETSPSLNWACHNALTKINLPERPHLISNIEKYCTFEDYGETVSLFEPEEEESKLDHGFGGYSSGNLPSKIGGTPVDSVTYNDTNLVSFSGSAKGQLTIVEDEDDEELERSYGGYSVGHIPSTEIERSQDTVDFEFKQNSSIVSGSYEGKQLEEVEENEPKKTTLNVEKDTESKPKKQNRRKGKQDKGPKLKKDKGSRKSKKEKKEDSARTSRRSRVTKTNPEE